MAARCSNLRLLFEPLTLPSDSPAGFTSIQRQTSVRVGPLGRSKDHLSCDEDVISCDLLEKSQGRPCAGCSGVAVEMESAMHLQIGPSGPQKQAGCSAWAMVEGEAKFISLSQVPLGETFFGIVRPIHFAPVQGRSDQTSRREPACFLLMNSSSN